MALEQAREKVRQLQEKTGKKFKLTALKYGDKYFYTATYKTKSGCVLDIDLDKEYMSWIGDKNDPEIREITNKVKELWDANEEAKEQ